MSECHLAQHVEDFVQKTHSLTTSVRILRREFAKCPHCDQFETCTLRKTFHDRIQSALTELTDEWNLSESL